MTEERQRELEGLLSEHGAFSRTIVQELLTALREARERGNRNAVMGIEMKHMSDQIVEAMRQQCRERAEVAEQEGFVAGVEAALETLKHLRGANQFSTTFINALCSLRDGLITVPAEEAKS